MRRVGSPICRLLRTQAPARHYFAGTFARLVAAMLGPGIHFVETERGAAGAAGRRFEVTGSGFDPALFGRGARRLIAGDRAGILHGEQLRSNRCERTAMDSVDADKGSRRVGIIAANAFLKVEVVAYLVLGFLLAVVALLGMFGAVASLWSAVKDLGAPETLVFTIDRLLLVLMVIEILHTVRVSFRSGALVSEPFLIVGLIASIRRMLVITMESSQVNQPGSWSPDSKELFDSTMLELTVLGGLILVMAISIAILRRSHRPAADRQDS
jgi:hypothetical protein